MTIENMLDKLKFWPQNKDAQGDITNWNNNLDSCYFAPYFLYQ